MDYFGRMAAKAKFGTHMASSADECLFDDHVDGRGRIFCAIDQRFISSVVALLDCANTMKMLLLDFAVWLPSSLSTSSTQVMFGSLRTRFIALLVQDSLVTSHCCASEQTDILLYLGYYLLIKLFTAKLLEYVFFYVIASDDFPKSHYIQQ